MAEQAIKQDNKQKQEAFINSLKDMLDYEIQVMEATGQDKTNKKEYDKKLDLLMRATHRPASDTLTGVVADELRKEGRDKDYYNMNYYDIAEKLQSGYSQRIQTARLSLFEAQSTKPLAETVEKQNVGYVALDASSVVGVAKSQGVKAEISKGFNTEVPNNVTLEVVERHLASKNQSQGQKQ